MFNVVNTEAYHSERSWSSSIHLLSYRRTSTRSTLILSYHLFLSLPSVRFPSDFRTIQ